MSSKYKIRTFADEYKARRQARLQISVGQLYHEGEKFLAAARWVASNFEQTLCQFVRHIAKA